MLIGKALDYLSVDSWAIQLRLVLLVQPLNLNLLLLNYRMEARVVFLAPNLFFFTGQVYLFELGTVDGVVPFFTLFDTVVKLNYIFVLWQLVLPLRHDQFLFVIIVINLTEAKWFHQISSFVDVLHFGACSIHLLSETRRAFWILVINFRQSECRMEIWRELTRHGISNLSLLLAHTFIPLEIIL